MANEDFINLDNIDLNDPKAEKQIKQIAIAKADAEIARIRDMKEHADLQVRRIQEIQDENQASFETVEVKNARIENNNQGLNGTTGTGVNGYEVAPGHNIPDNSSKSFEDNRKSAHHNKQKADHKKADHKKEVEDNKDDEGKGLFGFFHKSDDNKEDGKKDK